MKKFAAAVLMAGFTSVAFAGTVTEPVDVQLADDAFAAVGDTDTNINIPRPFNILAVADRAGFVKNTFQVTLSANVIAGIFDNNANNRMGVIAGSNKGYTLFTGSSVGGSVAQCGDPVASDTADLAASLVVEASVDLDADNGCAL